MSEIGRLPPVKGTLLERLLEVRLNIPDWKDRLRQIEAGTEGGDKTEPPEDWKVGVDSNRVFAFGLELRDLFEVELVWDKDR